MGNKYGTKIEIKEDFRTIDSIREESNQIFNSIENILSKEEKVDKFIKAINLDNTNEKIIKGYDKFLLVNKIESYEADIKEYLLFFTEIKDGKKEIFNFFDRMIAYKGDWEDRINFFQFLLKEINFFEQIKYKNNLPLIKNYNNIYYCKQYENLIKFLFEKYTKEKKQSLLKLIRKNTQEIENFKKHMIESKKYMPATIKEIDKIICCDFFQTFIQLLADFINKIKHFIDYLKETSVDEFLIDINKNELLDNLLFFIEKRKFTKTDNPIITNEYFIFNDSALDLESQIKIYKNEDIKITMPNNNALNHIIIITYKDGNPIKFNFDLYSLGYACNEIQIQHSKVCDYEKLKFSKFDINNFFRKIWENITKDIKDIFSSECIKDFLKNHNLFDLFNYNSQEILNDILENVKFYPFISENSYSCFSEDFQTIYLQGITIKEIDSAEYFIVLYAFQLICLIHELFQFYFSYMRFISKEKNRFNFPLQKNCSSYKIEEGGESRKYIEEKLFGRQIQNLSVKESLFIFSMKDYKGGFENFRKDFEKCNILQNGEFKFENFKKYIQKFNHIFASLEIEENNIDIDKSYCLSNKKGGVGEDIFVFKLPPYYQKELENTENILLNECMKKIKEKKENALYK